MAGPAVVVVTPQGAAGVFNVQCDDRIVGEVHLGANGEWYSVPPSRFAMANPIDGLDGKKGTGSPTPQAAAEFFRPDGYTVAIES